MVKLSKGLGRFAENAREHAIRLMGAFGVFTYDEACNTVVLAADADVRRSKMAEQHQLVPMWASFSIGVECLLKAVLCHHESLPIKKGKVSERLSHLRPEGKNYGDARHVLTFVGGIDVYAEPDTWLSRQLAAEGIDKLYDVNTGTLEDNINALKKLFLKGLITREERWTLHNALLVLKDIRRNIDLHTFHGITVGGSFGGDLEKLYLPAVNLLLEVYSRSPASEGSRG
jgi:hypothetical protein